MVFSGRATVSYTGGNGVAFTAGAAITSTGVTGLTAALPSRTLAISAGNITYAIAGMPTYSAVASLELHLADGPVALLLQ